MSDNEDNEDFDAESYFQDLFPSGRSKPTVDDAPEVDNSVPPDSELAGQERGVGQPDKFAAFDVPKIAQEILTRWYQSVDSIFEVADTLCQYESLLDDSQMFELRSALSFSDSWYSMMRAIDKEADGRFKDIGVRRMLPPSYSVIYRLAKLPENLFEAALKDGLIGPEMTREDADKLRPNPKHSPKSRNVVRFLVTETALTEKQDEELDELLGPICERFHLRCVTPKRRLPPTAGAA